MTVSEERAEIPAAGFLLLVDEEGCRHLIRVEAVQLASDVDLCRDSLVLVVAGRGIRVPRPLDHVLGLLTGRGP